MSLIHEALKKAEQQRQLGEPPTLASPYGTPRRQRSSLPFVLPLIAIALGVGWWVSRSSVAPPTSSNEQNGAAVAAATPNRPAIPAPTAPTEAAASSAAERRPNASRLGLEAMPPPAVGLARGAPLPHGVAATKAPSVKDIAERESEPMPAGANPLAPGEVAAQALAAAPLSDAAINDPQALALKSTSKRAQGEAPVVLPAASPAATPPATAAPISTIPNVANESNASNASKQANVALATPTPVTMPTAPTTAAGPAVPTPKAAAPAPPPAPPSVAATPPPSAAPVDHTPLYWELPLNLRKDLPALNLTMHVYSAEPAQRFVVLNGNRQKEGDDLGSEVKLTEIRADGIVLEFHGQRFLVPRGGG